MPTATGTHLIPILPAFRIESVDALIAAAREET